MRTRALRRWLEANIRRPHSSIITPERTPLLTGVRRGQIETQEVRQGHAETLKCSVSAMRPSGVAKDKPTLNRPRLPIRQPRHIMTILWENTPSLRISLHVAVAITIRTQTSRVGGVPSHATPHHATSSHCSTYQRKESKIDPDPDPDPKPTPNLKPNPNPSPAIGAKHHPPTGDSYRKSGSESSQLVNACSSSPTQTTGLVEGDSQMTEMEMEMEI